jgi:phosphoribosylanthranilate isomerase
VSRTRIKICGVTRPQDALAAANAGADAIGMILHADASPRQISIDIAKDIVSALPPMTSAIGVFVDAPSELIIETAGQLRLRCVQLHGNESPNLVAALGDLQVIKAIRLGAAEQSMDAWRNAPCQLRAILLESAPGGSGVESDWQRIAALLKRTEVLRSHKFVAAGGLTPDNVAEVIRLLRPWAVDVSSGVEESVGIKSVTKIESFCEAVRRAEMDQ